jgi:hypothetical protein
MKLTKRQLQAQIDRAVKHGAIAHDALQIIDEHCIEVYGAVAGEFDCDSIIDAVQGGSGKPSGMTADEFDKEMRDSIKLSER